METVVKDLRKAIGTVILDIITYFCMLLYHKHRQKSAGIM